MGDKINIRNTADCSKDYLLYNNHQYFTEIYLIKRPTDKPLYQNFGDTFSTSLFRWRSSDPTLPGGYLDPSLSDYRFNPSRTYTFTTLVSFVLIII